MFSQFDEERIILDYWGDRVATFLDIGAWDGIELSNTRALVLKGWRGLLVEPCVTAFDALLKNSAQFPGLVFANAAVSSSRQIRKFHAQDMWGGTLNDDRADKESRVNVANYYVLTMSPGDIWGIGNREGMSFEFVSLDAEWMDFEILSSCNELLEKTELLCAEVTDNLFKDNDPIPALCSQFGFNRVIGKTQCNLIVAK